MRIDRQPWSCCDHEDSTVGLSWPPYRTPIPSTTATYPAIGQCTAGAGLPRHGAAAARGQPAPGGGGRGGEDASALESAHTRGGPSQGEAAEQEVLRAALQTVTAATPPCMCTCHGCTAASTSAKRTGGAHRTLACTHHTVAQEPDHPFPLCIGPLRRPAAGRVLHVTPGCCGRSNPIGAEHSCAGGPILHWILSKPGRTASAAQRPPRAKGPPRRGRPLSPRPPSSAWHGATAAACVVVCVSLGECC